MPDTHVSLETSPIPHSAAQPDACFPPARDMPAIETVTQVVQSEPVPSGTEGLPVHPVQPSEPDAHEEPELQGKSGFPVVGIGASAGGLAAFEAFFSGMPVDTDTGMAFVLVQHLAPDHKSILSELVRRYTRMHVFEVVDGIEVQPDCAYIIPPNRDMAFLNGKLHLMEPSGPRGRRLPIDFFFRSLAQDQHERAICIVLSGSGSDGSLGVRAVKGEGGMVMVQSPDSAEYDGMPRSALATGLADYELQPAQMPAQLLAYTARAYSGVRVQDTHSVSRTENALRRIFILLRTQTGHDFSHYKPSTINRRIDRRMAVNQIETIENYVTWLQKSKDEVEALFRDLLIGVTSFFRDPEAFSALEDLVVPGLLVGKSANSMIRIWVPGCSTGEEAYSIAILMQEYMESLRLSFMVQIFATDIDSNSIATARAGIYPASIAADISEERLSRHFTLESGVSDVSPGFYRIHKNIRDMLVFSEQDLIRDPPFSKLDLVSCRNLLIYMDTELQKRVIPLFHYALNPGGFLFLGTSETVGEFSDLFSVLDRKAKLYLRRDELLGTKRSSSGILIPSISLPDAPRDWAVPIRVMEPKLSLRDLTERALLARIAPAAVLTTAHGNIVYFHGRTGRYLEPAPGDAGVSNVFRMAREGLQRAVTTGLRKAVESGEAAVIPDLRVKTNGDYSLVTLTISPVREASGIDPEQSLFLVIMQDQVSHEVSPEAPVPVSAGPKNQLEQRMVSLRAELQAKEEYIQSFREELETSNEELKSSNEEMQSVNEELQSTNEELETSKEELQSVNEELATVNAELQAKVADLSRSNNDMNNLLAGTGIGTIFVDHQLRILRYTPSVTRIINLIASDVGRPVRHIVSNMTNYSNLVADAQMVLETLLPREVEVETIDGRWYTLRILPYRTLDNVIEGAVITFFEITDMKRTEASLRNIECLYNEYLRQRQTAGFNADPEKSGEGSK